MRKVIGRIFSFVLLLITVTTVVFAGLSLLSRGDPANTSTWALGAKPLVVLGGSMEPAIHLGSIVVVRRAEAASVEVGDVITYRTPNEAAVTSLKPGTITTHRVVKVEETPQGRQFVTRGDANEDDDPWPVTDEDLLGRVAFAVPYAGYLSRAASTREGLLLLVVVPALLLIASEVTGMVKGRKKNGQPAGADR